MPHLEEQFPPINPLILQRPDALSPPDPQEDREEDEQAQPVANRGVDEAPQPGSLADGIDRVSISANARVIVPVQPGVEAVPVPTELIPGEADVNPEVPQLLTAEIEARERNDLDPTAIEIPTGNGLQNFNNGLVSNRRATEAGPIIRNAGNDESVALGASGNSTPQTPAPRELTLLTPNGTRTLDLQENPLDRNIPGQSAGAPESNPNEPNTLGLRGTTPLPRTEQRVNIEIPAALQIDPLFPNIEETRNFGEGRTLSLDLESSGNDDAAIAINTIDEALEEGGALPSPETPRVPEPELIIAPAVQPAFVPEPELVEESTQEPINRLTLENTEANAQPIAPPEPTGELEPELQENETATGLPDPRDLETEREPVIETDTFDPNAVVSSLTDSQTVLEEDNEFQDLQPPAFPELDNDEPFIPARETEPEPAEEGVPAAEQFPANPEPPAFENEPPVAAPEPGNVERLNENPQALRGDNLGTDPALRSNREIRNYLQQFNERFEPPEEVADDEGAPVAEVQNNAPPPPAVFENLEALSEELLISLREEQATQGVTRPEEEHTAPPPPRTPETVVTERGQNIDRFI